MGEDGCGLRQGWEEPYRLCDTAFVIHPHGGVIENDALKVAHIREVGLSSLLKPEMNTYESMVHGAGSESLTATPSLRWKESQKGP